MKTTTIAALVLMTSTAYAFSKKPVVIEAPEKKPITTPIPSPVPGEQDTRAILYAIADNEGCAKAVYKLSLIHI